MISSTRRRKIEKRKNGEAVRARASLGSSQIKSSNAIIQIFFGFFSFRARSQYIAAMTHIYTYSSIITRLFLATDEPPVLKPKGQATT